MYSRRLDSLADDDVEKIASEVDAPFLLALIRHKDATDDRSGKASELVAAFCAKHQQVDFDTFEALTNASSLPIIHASAAWRLLQTSSELMDPQSATFASLEERCIDGLAKEFGNLDMAKGLRFKTNQRRFW